MRKQEREKALWEKIESFRGEPEYEVVKRIAAACQEKGGLESRILMDKLLIMPKDYIIGYIHNKNNLSFREEDKRMLQAFLSGYEQLQREHMNMEIHKTSLSMLKQYQREGYAMIQKKGDVIYVGKRI